MHPCPPLLRWCTAILMLPWRWPSGVVKPSPPPPLRCLSHAPHPSPCHHRRCSTSSSRARTYFRLQWSATWCWKMRRGPTDRSPTDETRKGAGGGGGGGSALLFCSGRRLSPLPVPLPPQAAAPIGLSPEGMLSQCTWAQDAASTKTQKENRLVSGLTDHRYLSVTRARHRGASGQATNTRSNGSQRYVENHRQAGTIGPELLTPRPPPPSCPPSPPGLTALCRAHTEGGRPPAPFGLLRCSGGRTSGVPRRGPAPPNTRRPDPSLGPPAPPLVPFLEASPSISGGLSPPRAPPPPAWLPLLPLPFPLGGCANG